MKILLLADPNLSHTIKWARSLANHGLLVGILGLPSADRAIYQHHPVIQLYTLGFDNSLIKSNLGSFSKLRYLQTLPKVREVINEFKPDIVHAHFATSYGLLGALSGFHPFILSVWGADIFDFPLKSFLHKTLIKYNLSQADRVLSTSHVMAEETHKYTTKPIEVTPFGIDTDLFKPQPVKSLFEAEDIVIGTVKTLEKKYGIDYLIRAFRLLKQRHPGLPLKLLIVGGGSQEKYLKNLTDELELSQDTVFTGRVSYDEVPSYHNMLTVFASLSILDSESFGVAVIEASACEKPVVVANVGGLPEVVKPGVTGLVVERSNPVQAAEAIEALVLDRTQRQLMGKAGREWVIREYNWSDNIQQMINIYNDVLAPILPDS
jgi:glycosyltransferase involved in cell wall biosynthesis